MSATPAISVVMPAWNAAPFVDAAVASILGQTWRDFEFIVLDDASTDGTRERLAAWAARDARIRLVANERNLGIALTLGRGLALARAPWIARMDADDVSRPGRLAREWAAAERSPGANLITCRFDLIDAAGRERKGSRGVSVWPGLLPWFMLFYNRIGAGGQTLMAAEALRAARCFEEEQRISCDFVAWTSLLRQAPPVLVDEPLYLWRMSNPNSVTKQHAFRYAEPGMAIAREELRARCGLAVDRRQFVALRDFWMRHPEPGNDWDEVQRLLLAAIAGYRPPYPIADFARHARTAVTCGWLSNAVRAVRQRNLPLARAHVRRAREAGGGGWPWRFLRVGALAARVGGKLGRLV